MNILLLAMGLYLFFVVYQGNTQAFLQFLMDQKAFVVWAAALVLYLALAQVKSLAPFVQMFGAVVLAAFAINAAQSGAFQQQWNAFVSGNW